METEKVKRKLTLYAMLITPILLHGIYKNDQEVINCSLLVLSTCGIFYWLLTKEE